MMAITVRGYILTERERKLIDDVVNGGKPNGFRVLKHLMIRALPRLEEDLKNEPYTIHNALYHPANI
jgi:hypothetical protein